jgi:hypothetical protein
MINQFLTPIAKNCTFFCIKPHLVLGGYLEIWNPNLLVVEKTLVLQSISQILHAWLFIMFYLQRSEFQRVDSQMINALCALSLNLWF